LNAIIHSIGFADIKLLLYPPVVHISVLLTSFSSHFHSYLTLGSGPLVSEHVRFLGAGRGPEEAVHRGRDGHVREGRRGGGERRGRVLPAVRGRRPGAPPGPGQRPQQRGVLRQGAVPGREEPSRRALRPTGRHRRRDQEGPTGLPVLLGGGEHPEPVPQVPGHPGGEAAVQRGEDPPLRGALQQNRRGEEPVRAARRADGNQQLRTVGSRGG